MRAFAIVVLLAGVAAADGTTFQGKVVTAETAEKAARESRDPAAYEMCGEAYLEVANAARTELPDFVPDAMYNAAYCFELSGSVGAAIKLYTQLEAEFPKHKLVAHALAKRARLYMAMAWYAEAAKDLEVYAVKYAGEKDASDALENAFMLRAALGDDDAARADAERWIKMFGAKQPREAARAALRLAWMTRERGTPEAAMREYQEWIKRYGSKADRELVVSAYLALGEIAWDASCKVKGTPKGGLCLAPAKESKVPRCGNAPMVAVARDKTLAGEARKAFGAAARFSDILGDHSLAPVIADRARLYLADARIEESLTAFSSPPTPVLDARGVTTEASVHELRAWIDEWQKGLMGANRAYEVLIRSRNQRVAVAAVGRMAWLTQHASDVLMSVPLPKKKPAFDQVETQVYCGTLTQYAQPLSERAYDAANVCLEQAFERGVVDETAQCVAVRDRHYPPGASAGERLPAAAWPRVRDVEPEIRYRPPGTIIPSPP